MFDFKGFVESGAFSAPGITQFFISHNPKVESRLNELDGETRKKVIRHMDDFHSEEEMERFIDHLTNGGRTIT